MGKLSVIGKVHIKDIKVLREWHASGEFKKWHKGNWSPSCAASNRTKWEDTDQIGFYQMQERIPGLSKSLDRTDSWIGELLEMAEYLQSIGQSLNLLYLDDQHRFAVISGADTEEAYTLPCRFLEIEEYKDYSDYAPDQMCSIAGETLSSIIPAGQGFSSVTDIKKDIYSKEEELKEQEYTEEWAFELACLYHKAGMADKCVEACDELVLWFGDGPYVERALELKMIYQPLNKQQEEKYRRFCQKREGVVEVRPEEELDSGEIVNETVQIPDVKLSPERFNTQNLQEELQKSMQQIMQATEKETVTDRKL